MPTYSYRCPNCGQTYEKFQRISDKTRAKCPQCGTRGERQISGGAGLVFKGSGFYVTDYKRAGGKGSGGERAAGDKTGERASGSEPERSGSDVGATKSVAREGDS